MCEFQNVLMVCLIWLVFLCLPIKPLLWDRGRKSFVKPNELILILYVIQLSQGDVIKPQQRQGSAVFPVIHRQYIYFFSSKENKEAFMTNPIKYICQPKPKLSMPVKIAIVGLPKSGKTTGMSSYLLKKTKQHFLMTEVVSVLTVICWAQILLVAFSSVSFDSLILHCTSEFYSRSLRC